MCTQEMVDKPKKYIERLRNQLKQNNQCILQMNKLWSWLFISLILNVTQIHWHHLDPGLALSSCWNKENDSGNYLINTQQSRCGSMALKYPGCGRREYWLCNMSPWINSSRRIISNEASTYCSLRFLHFLIAIPCPLQRLHHHLLQLREKLAERRKQRNLQEPAIHS